MPAPTLQTERLTLRHHQMRDFEAYADLWASQRALYMGQKSRSEAWYAFCSDIAQWDLLGHGAWAIEKTKDQTVVGQIALIHPPESAELELGWFVFAPHEGQGIAFEAAVAARDWAFDLGGFSSFVSYIDPQNARSIALAERLGAARDDKAPRPEPDDLVYRHQAPHAQVEA